MLTEKDYCDYETCVALIESGYPEHEILSYDFNLSLYEAQKWMREEKHLRIEVRWYSNLWYKYEVKDAEGKILAEGSAFKTYEEALSTAVYMATEYLKEK